MWQSNHNLAALIGSRICHDLISPIGAISNGLELMTLDGRAGSPEMALISDSVNHANARIRFMRVAYGLAGEGQTMGRSEIAAILADLAQGARAVFDWTPQADCLRAEVQEVFLALQCFESAMPRGGTVTVTRAGGDDGRWEVSGPADPARPDPALWTAMGDPAGHGAPHAVQPAHVQFALLPALLTERGRRLSLDTRDGVTLRF